MKQLRKTVKLPALQGVLFTDPSYESGTWCRYERDISLEGWVMDYHAADRNDDGYCYTSFMLVIAKPDIADHIQVKPDTTSFSCPSSLETSQRIIGMDTASIYLGAYREFDSDDWQPGCALRTGTDGEFGTVYELSDADEEIAAIILFGFVDGHFGTKESVWEYLQSTFEIKEQQN